MAPPELATKSGTVATELAGEWVFWSSGKVDFLTVTMEAKETLTRVAIGAGIAFLAAFLLVWRLARRRVPAVAPTA
jgi:hypothetical protein